jgi:hypothetical protein
MIGIFSGVNHTCSGPTRREVLRIGGLSAFGVGLHEWLRQAASAGAATKPTPQPVNCILVWMIGGPSQIETYDLKPHAPMDVRGEFNAIQSNAPGMQVCELMPRLARCTDLYSVIRSMTSITSSHPDGHYYVNSGRMKTPAFTPAGYGSAMVQQVGQPHGIPGYVQLGGTYRPDVAKGGYLGHQHDPIVIPEDPNKSKLNLRDFTLPGEVSIDRISGRRSLLSALDQFQAKTEAAPVIVGTHDEFYERAFSIVTSPKTKQAFDLTQEPDKVRDEYGRNRLGQRLLLSRRLIEAGVRFVRISGYIAAGYDTHFKHWETMKKELPAYDQGYSALLNDLKQRGLLDNTLVITMGEFGRTPRINKQRGGRDHWARCFSLTMGGGGVRTGEVVGESDKIGADPKRRRLTIPDLAHTIYRGLGLDPHAVTYSIDGRPIVALPEGEPIRELI